jgi:hypothetical protein
METRAELEERFGPDPTDWPAPYRGSPGEGDFGLLHRALVVDPDETALTRAVLSRLAQPEPTFLPDFLSPRIALAGYAGLWLAMAALGWQGVGGAMGAPLLALTLGDFSGWAVLQ